MSPGPANRGSQFADLLRELRRVLKEERAALLSGRAEQIEGITRQKMALVETIERETDDCQTASADIATLKTLARYNRENAVICSAMLRHMTAALDRLHQRDPHRSYRPDGSEHNPPTQRLIGAA